MIPLTRQMEFLGRQVTNLQQQHRQLTKNKNAINMKRKEITASTTITTATAAVTTTSELHTRDMNVQKKWQDLKTNNFVSNVHSNSVITITVITISRL